MEDSGTRDTIMKKTKGEKKTVFTCKTERERSELEIKRSKSSAFETRERIRLTFSESQKLAKGSLQSKEVLFKENRLISLRTVKLVAF